MVVCVLLIWKCFVLLCPFRTPNFRSVRMFNECKLVDRPEAAKKAGFDAVECAWPYDTPASELNAAAKKANINFVLVNTPFQAGKGEVCIFFPRVESCSFVVFLEIIFFFQPRECS